MGLTIRVPERLQPALKVAPVRPAYAAGVRAAMATVAPLLLAFALDDPALTWASIAGFSVSLADRGGAYRTRATSMGALVAAGTAAAALGGLLGESSWVAVPALFAVAVLASLGRVYGNTAGVIGASVATTFFVSLALPAHSLREAAVRGLLFVAGGAWAMLLALLLWPLRPFRPARLDLQRCYRSLATYASLLADRLGRGEAAAAGEEHLFAERSVLREALEAARATLVAIRRGRHESGRTERLLVLLEVADQSFGTLLALGEVLESAPLTPAAQPARDATRKALDAFASTALYVARIVGEELRAPPPSLGWSAEPIRRAAAAADEGDGAELARAAYAQAATLIDQLHGAAAAAGETAATLEEKGAWVPVAGSAVADPAPPTQPTSLLTPLRDALGRESVALRHALRVGIVVAAGAWLAAALGLARGYWVTLTVLLVLQPQSGATFIRVVQRVAGTVLGGVIAAFIGWAVHDTAGILVVVFVLAAASVALLPVNYGVFSIFLTPTFVLLAEVNAGDWHLAQVRVLNTVIGGVLALLGARLLWPQAGRAPVEQLLGEAFAALRDYLARIAEYERGQGAPQGSLRALGDARRAVGLAVVNAETAFQWRLGEARRASSSLEPTMAALTYTRRLTAASTALTWTTPGDPPDRAAEAVAAFAEAARDVVADLAEVVPACRPPRPLPAGIPPEPVVLSELDPLLRAQLERARRQLTTLHAAAARLAGIAPEPFVPASDGAGGPAERAVRAGLPSDD